MTPDSWPAAVQAQLRSFAEERDWTQYHTPKNLLLALVGEVGELAELYQWSAADTTPDGVADEVADVMIYLLRFADVVGVDVDAAVRNKIRANGARYDVATWRGRAGKAP